MQSNRYIYHYFQSISKSVMTWYNEHIIISVQCLAYSHLLIGCIKRLGYDAEESLHNSFLTLTSCVFQSISNTIIIVSITKHDILLQIGLYNNLNQIVRVPLQVHTYILCHTTNVQPIIKSCSVRCMVNFAFSSAEPELVNLANHYNRVYKKRNVHGL